MFLVIKKVTWKLFISWDGETVKIHHVKKNKVHIVFIGGFHFLTGREGRNRGRQRSEQKTIIGNIWFLGGSLMASPPHYTHSSDSLVGAWRPLPLTTYTFMCFTFGTMCTYFLFLKSNYNKSLSQLHYILSSIQSVNRSLLFIFGGDLRLVLKRKKRF